MTTHFRILAWRILQTEEPGGLQSRGRKELDMTERTHTPNLMYNKQIKTGPLLSSSEGDAFIKYYLFWEFLGGPVVWTPLQQAGVRSLVGKLRSCRQLREAKK